MNYKIFLSIVSFAAVGVLFNSHAQGQQAIENGEGKSHSAAERVAILDPSTGELIASDGSEVAIDQAGNVVINGSEPKNKETEQVELGVGVASAPQLMSDGSLKIDFNGQFDRPIKASIDDKGQVSSGHHIDQSQEADHSEHHH